MAGPRTYTGVIHVHSERSPGSSGSIEDIVAAAKENEVDFVVITDHGTRGFGSEGLEGWRDGVLLLCGEEVITPEAHLLAFETREDIGKVEKLDEALERLRNQSGVAVATHLQLFEQERKPPACIAKPLDLEKADIIEVWSFMDEFLTRCQWQTVYQAHARPDKLVMGPSRRTLWKWDRQLEQRRVPIIGGVNVHQRKQPLLEWKTFFPYNMAFQTICTCVQTPELPTVSLRARDMVWNALREGRSYIVNRSVGSEKGFDFCYDSAEGRTFHMGQETIYTPGGKIKITVPQPAEVVLRHNGQPLFWGTASEMEFCTPMPGSYRVEVMLNRRTWILSNAIRLMDEEGVIQPTVSDVT